MRLRPSPISLPGSLFAVLLLSGSASSQTTSRLSLGPGGVQGNGFSVSPVLSADGRYVLFQSGANNLVAGDTNGVGDVFLRDLQAGTTVLVSVSSAGVQGNNGSNSCGLSADGRFVAFTSAATNLVPSDSNATYDAFLRDLQNGTTERVSLGAGGVQGDGQSSVGPGSISADGRFVVFSSMATNFVAGDTNLVQDVFVRDRQIGTTERVSVGSGGTQGNGHSFGAGISADGRYVLFASLADDLVPGDTNQAQDVFVRDRQSGTTERVSVGPNGAQADGACGTYGVAMSADGRFIAFDSSATNLVPGDTNGWRDVFVRDRQLGTTERVSVDSAGTQSVGGDSCFYGLSISADGRYVAFASDAVNLVPGDTNHAWDVFVHDRQLGTTERVSVDSSEGQGGDDSGTYGVAVSASGGFVAFESKASNLVSGDTNGVSDVFGRDRIGSGFTSLCDPGASGVIACPCSNPPAGSGRGCDNSSSTGGAILSAGGAFLLSADTLAFTTSGQRPQTASVLVQGTAAIQGGAVYGQGVRCVGGALSRLFTKSATAGGITVPDFAAGDPPVSVRSTALGDTIQAGESRWYLVLYRDANVLGGCPATSYFNTTQTGQVTWGP